MIQSFGDRATEALFHGQSRRLARKFPPDIRKVAVRKLDMLNAASVLEDMKSPPGNRLEALKGAYRGFHSIRVNDQWRVVFRWKAGDAHDVQVVDYHD